MFQLILHHTYRGLTQAIDLSGFNHHGQTFNTVHNTSGMSVKSGAVSFNKPSSRICVPPSGVLSRLGAIRVETWVNIKSLGMRRNLVEGHLSFAFFVEPSGALWGTAGTPTSGGGWNWTGANSITNSPDQKARRVPLSQWTRLTYEHNGFTTIRLWIDDQLVAVNYGLMASVAGVGPLGLHIGNWPDANQYWLDGQIDDVKLWRLHPMEAEKQFFCRPLSAEAWACWKSILDHYARLHRDSTSARKLNAYLDCLTQLFQRVQLRLLQTDPSAAREMQRFWNRYKKLWCAGSHDGRQMVRLIEGWADWICRQMGHEAFQDFIAKFQACEREHEVSRLVKSTDFKCLPEADKAFVEYLRRFEPAFRPCGNRENPERKG